MKYHYSLTTVDGAGVAHVTKGVVEGPPPAALSAAMHESFDILTTARPTFEKNGHRACAGPFTITSVKLESLET